MSVLANFPMVSQKTTITGDGQLSEDALYECVAASIDAACRYLLGQPENSVFNPDDFKDHGAGQGYVGATAAKEYVEFCASLGVRLYAEQGNPGHLVELAHQFLADGKPVIFTEPDPYVSASLGWSHVCVWMPNEKISDPLVAMDPFIARSIRRTDQEWLNLVLNNEIWILEKAVMSIDLTNGAVVPYFRADTLGWKCVSTGKNMHGEILAFYQVYGNSALCGLTHLGLPVSNEVPLNAKGNVRQHFERGVLFFDPGHAYDAPPGAGRVYLAHLYSGPGQDPQIAELQTEIAQLKSQPAAPQLDATLRQMVQEGASMLGLKLV